MLLFRAHDFVSGGLAHCFGHGGSRYTVLGSGDPVRNALPRHLLLPGRSDKGGNLQPRLGFSSDNTPKKAENGASA